MKSIRILVAEDEPIIGLDIQNTLQNLGYDVPEVVSSGEDAVKKSEELKPDIILMDIVLSGKIDGIDAVKQITEKQDIPIIYLTAHTEKITFDLARETNPYGYLVKPLGKSDLYTAIETALHRHEMERKLRESEGRMSLAQQAADIGTWDLNLQDDILTWSDEIYLHFGLKPNEITPTYEAFDSFIHPDDKEQVNKAVQQALEDKKPYSLDARMLRADGTEWVMHARGTAITD